MKSLVDEIVVTIVEIAVTALIVPNGKINYWLVLLATACLPLLVIINIKYCMKRILAIHAYYHISIERSSVREMNIKTRTYYFSDEIISIKNLDPNNIKIQKLLYNCTKIVQKYSYLLHWLYDNK